MSYVQCTTAHYRKIYVQNTTSHEIWDYILCITSGSTLFHILCYLIHEITDNSIVKPPGCITTSHKWFAYPETLYSHSNQWTDCWPKPQQIPSVLIHHITKLPSITIHPTLHLSEVCYQQPWRRYCWELGEWITLVDEKSWYGHVKTTHIVHQNCLLHSKLLTMTILLQG